MSMKKIEIATALLRWVLGGLLIVTALSSMVSISCVKDLMGAIIIETCGLVFEQSMVLMVLAAVQLLLGLCIVVPKTTWRATGATILFLLAVSIKLFLEGNMFAVWVNIGLVVVLCCLMQLLTIRNRYISMR